MALLPEGDAETLRNLFEDRLHGPVTLDLFTRESRLVVPGRAPCEGCRETRALLENVALLSDHITLTVHDVDAPGSAAGDSDIEHLPTIVIGGAAKGTIRWLGLPAGYEFSAFVDLLLDVGNGDTDLQPATKDALVTLTKDVTIQVFVTAACPYCPAAAQIAQRMAVESPRVRVQVIEAEEFPDLVRRYQVNGVPKVIVNETIAFAGAQTEARFLDYVLEAGAASAVTAEHSSVS